MPALYTGINNSEINFIKRDVGGAAVSVKKGMTKIS